MDNVKPAVEVRSRRVGGATYQGAVEVRPERARRWRSLAHRIRAQPASTHGGASFRRVMDAANNRGAAVKKRETRTDGRSQQGFQPLPLVTKPDREARDGQGKFERTKPHVNIGTIGHVDLQDVADGGDHQGPCGEGGRRSRRTTRSTRPEEKARGSRSRRRMWIYETENRHYAMWIALGTRLREEHDHGAAQMDGAILVVWRRMVRCRRRASTSCWRAVGVPALVVF